MNLEVFEGVETAEEAVQASYLERQRRLYMYVDLRTDGVLLDLFRHLPEKELHILSNQISVACNGRNGVTEKLARRLEYEIGIPFGFFDQPLPARELRASLARGVRLVRKLAKYDLDQQWMKRSKTKIRQVIGAAGGYRGVSKTLYLEVIAALKPKKGDGLSALSRIVVEALSSANKGKPEARANAMGKLAETAKAIPLYAQALSDLEDKKVE